MLLSANNVTIGQIAQPAGENRKSETPRADESFASVLSGQNAKVQSKADGKTDSKAEMRAFGFDDGKKKPGKTAESDAPKAQSPKDAEEESVDEKKDDGSANSNAYIAQLLMMQPQPEAEPADNTGVEPEQFQDLNVLEGLNVQTEQQAGQQAVADTVPSTGDAEEMARTPEIIIPLEGIEHEAEAAPEIRRANPSPLENVQKPDETSVTQEAAPQAQLAKPLEESGQTSGDKDSNTGAQDQEPQIAVPTYAFNMAPVERFEVPAEPVAPPLPQALAETAVSQTIETIAMGVQNGQQVISIQMKPEFLGRLEVQLLMGAEGLTARIRTSDPAVQSTIASQINQMQEALKDKGIEVKEVEVLLSAQQEFMDDQHGSNQQFREGKTRYARVGSVEAQITPIVTYGDELQMENLNGSVDFTA